MTYAYEGITPKEVSPWALHNAISQFQKHGDFNLSIWLHLHEETTS